METGDRTSFARHVGYVALIFIALFSSITHATADGFAYNTIALTGAPGASLGFGPNLESGVYFDGFTNLTLNNNGDVSFRGALIGTGVDASNNVGLFKTTAGTSTALARTGSASLGPNLGSGVVFSSFTSSNMSPAGELSFYGRISGTGVDSSNSAVIYRSAQGNKTLLARSGTPGPGPNLGSGVEFLGFLGHLFANASGDLSFWASLKGTGIDSSNSSALFKVSGGTLAAFARKGSSGPGPNLGPGVDFNALSPIDAQPLINSSGTIAFSASLTGAAVDSTNNHGIFRNSGGVTSVIVRSGASGPGPNLGAGVHFADLLSEFPDFNANGDVAFVSTLTGTGVDSTNNQGMFKNAGGTTSVVARTGAGGPGPSLGSGVNFAGFTAPHLNTNGDLAFLGLLTGAGVDSTNDAAVFKSAGGSLTAIAREGIAGPGPNLGPGVHYLAIYEASLLTINARGDVAFTADLTGAGVNTFNDSCLSAFVNGRMETILREGDLFDVNPSPTVSDLRTVTSVSLEVLTGSSDGREMSYNDNGMLLFRAVFSDGSNGLFTATLVPEPTTLLLLIPAPLLLTRRRRPHR